MFPPSSAILAQATSDHGELVWAGVITSSVALVGILITAILARSNSNNLKANGMTAAAILGEMNTGNGHSLGTAVARIEETLWRHENRLDAIEVEMRETKEVIEEHRAAIEQAALE